MYPHQSINTAANQNLAIRYITVFCNSIPPYKWLNVWLTECCSTQTKYWIPVLEAYWSMITSMAFYKILLQYQYSIEILNYFPVSLSVFQKKIRGPKFENLICLKIYHFRKFIVINFFHVNNQISDQKCQIVYIIEQNVIHALNK